MQYNEVSVEKDKVSVEVKKRDYSIRLEEVIDCGKTKNMKDESVITLSMDLNKEGISLLDRKR